MSSIFLSRQNGHSPTWCKTCENNCCLHRSHFLFFAPHTSVKVDRKRAKRTVPHSHPLSCRHLAPHIINMWRLTSTITSLTIQTLFPTPHFPLLISHSSFPTPHFPHLISHTWFPATHKTHPTPFTAQPTNFTTNPLPSPLISQLSHLPSHFSPLISHLSPLTSHLSLMSSHLLTCTSHPSTTFTLYDLTQNGVNSLLRWSSLCKYLTMSVTATRAHSRWRFYAVSHADGGELVVSLSLFFCVACPPLIFKFLSTIKSTLCLCDHCMPHRIRVIIPFHPPPPPPFHPPPPPPCHQWLTEQSVNRYMVF